MECITYILAPGDSGHLLHSMLQHTWPRPAAVAYLAPAVVAAAFRVGEKGVLPTGTTAGAEYDTQFGVKVPIGGAVVKKLFRAKFSIANPLHFMGGCERAARTHNRATTVVLCLGLFRHAVRAHYQFFSSNVPYLLMLYAVCMCTVGLLLTWVMRRR